MKILLDTHVWLWTLSAPERLSTATQDLLLQAQTEPFLSAASVWEIAIKYQLGKLPLPETPEAFIPKRLLRDGITPLMVSHLHAARVATLPRHHQDPFDRLLIAQAQLEKVPLMTADEKFRAYDVELLQAT